ncbi:MAG: TerC family protein [Longimicrobiales bacterium]
MTVPFWFWIGFGAFVLVMLALDLGVFHKKDHVISVKEATAWVGVWVSLALAFNVGIYFYAGGGPALEFLTGYLIEESLSVDNIFVFAVIFSYFKVPAQYQHKVLYWGIFGALVMRLTMILLGVALIERFDWVIYVFGAFLVYTGYRMATQHEIDIEPEHNPLVKLVRRFFRVTPRYHGGHFFVVQDGRKYATPLLIVVVVVEATDVVFAIDSIPAIFGITRDPFIVYTSNVFAILGLRSLYFALAGMLDRFHYLSRALAVVLIFVGVKMLISDYWHMPTWLALGFVLAVLSGAVVLSLLRPKPPEVDGIEVDEPPPGIPAREESGEAAS